MAPRIPLSELVRRASAQLKPPTGIRTGGEQFLPPELEGEVPGYPGSTGIGAPGMRVGDVPPEIDKALLQEAIGTGWSGGGGTQFPAAAQPPQTREELELDIDTPMVPGSSPYFPHQSVAPSMAEKDPYGVERFKAMNFSMTPVGMRDHFRNLGFEAEVAPHDKFAKAYHPMLEEIASGEGYNVIIQEPTTGDWHTLDPQSFELADLTDIASDAAITVASIMGANVAGAAAATGRQTAVHSMKKRAMTAAMGPLDDAAKAVGGVKHLAQEVGEEAVDVGIRRAAPAVHGLRALEEAAATPSTFLGPRVAGAVKYTVPPEAARQTIGAFTDVPEEGGGRRLGRGLMELGASGIGELADPFMGAKGLLGAKSRGEIKRWLKARDFAEKYKKPFSEPPPRAFEDIATPEQNLAAMKYNLGGRTIDPEDVADAGTGGIDPVPGREYGYQGSMEGRTIQSQLPGKAGGGLPEEGPVSRSPHRHQYEGDYTHVNELEMSTEMRDRINAVLAKEGKTIDSLSDDDQRVIYEIFQSMQGGRVGDENMTPVGFFRNADLLDEPVPGQPQSVEGVLARVMERGAEAQGADDIRPTGKQRTYAQKFIDNKRQHWAKLEKQGDPPDPKSRAQQEGVFRMLEKMDEGESFWIDGLVELKPTVVMRGGEKVQLRGGEKIRPEDQVVGGVEGWQALAEGDLASIGLISKKKQHVVRLGPTFMNAPAMKANLDSADGLADIAKMDWEDVVIAADDWRFDANHFKKTDAWDEAFDGSDGEQVFRYMLDHINDTDHGDPLAAIEPPDLTKMPAYDPEAHGILWLWADISEWGTSKQSFGRRRGWVSYKAESVEVLGREHITEAMPGPEHSTRPRPVLERLKADVTDVERQIQQTGRPPMGGRIVESEDLIPAETKALESVAAKGKKLKRLRAKPEAYEAHLERLGIEQASRHEAHLASKKALKEARTRKQKPVDPNKKRKKPMEEGDPIEGSIYDIYHPGAKALFDNNETYTRLIKGDLLDQAESTHKVYGKEKSTPSDPLEDILWAESAHHQKIIDGATDLLRNEEVLEKMGFEGMGLTMTSSKIGSWKFRGEGPNKGFMLKDAIEAMGGANHPGFRATAKVDKAQAAGELVQTMLTGEPSPAWSAHIWAPELRETMNKSTLNRALKNLLNEHADGTESFYRDFRDPDKLLGTAVDDYSRYRGFIKDLMVMWRTTPEHLSRIQRAKYMIQEFYNPHHQTGLYEPGSGLFDVLSRDYDAFNGEGGLYHWFAGNLRMGSDAAVNMGRDVKKINELKTQALTALDQLGYSKADRQTRVDNALRALGEQHPDLEKEGIIVRVALRDDSNSLPSDLMQSNGQPWDRNRKLRQEVPATTEARVEIQQAHADDINEIPGQTMLDSFKEIDTGHKITTRPPELKHRLKYLGWTDDEIAKVGSGAEGAMTHEGAYVRANFGIKKGSQLDTNLKAHEADPNTPFRTKKDGDQPDPRDDGEGDTDGGGEQQQQGQGRGDGGGKKKKKKKEETKKEKKARLKKEKDAEAERKRKEKEDDKDDEEPDETGDGDGDGDEPEGPRDPGDMDAKEVLEELDKIDINDEANAERWQELQKRLQTEDPGEHKKYIDRIFGSGTEFWGDAPDVKLHPHMQQPGAGGEVPKKPEGMHDVIWELVKKQRDELNEEDILVRGGGEGEESYVTTAHVRGGPQERLDVSAHKQVTVIEKGVQREAAFLDVDQPGVSLTPARVARLAGHYDEAFTEGVYIDYGSGQGRRGITAPGGWQSGWIHEGGPMWNAGVRRGDFVYAINGKTPTGHEGMRRIMAEAFKKKGPVEILLIRSVNGKAQKYKAKFELSDTDVWREPKRPETRLREEIAQTKTAKYEAAVKALEDGEEEVEIGLIGGIVPHSYLTAAAAIKAPGEYSGKLEVTGNVIDTETSNLAVSHPELRGLRIHAEGWEQGIQREPVHLTWRKNKDGDLVIKDSTAWGQKGAFYDVETKEKGRILDRSWDLQDWELGEVINIIDAPYLHPSVPVEIRQLAAWSVDDLKALYKKHYGSAWKPEPQRDLPTDVRAIMGLQWETGLRINEIVALKEEDIRTFTAQMLQNSRALKDIHIMLALRKNKRPKADSHGRHPLFVNKNNAEMSTDSAHKLYKKWMVEYKKRPSDKLPFRNTTHALRHSIATHMMDMGAHINMVKDLLGHKGVNRMVRKVSGDSAARWHMTKAYTQYNRGLTKGQRWMEADEPITLASKGGPVLTGATMEGADPGWEAKTFTIEQMRRIRASEHLNKDTFASKRNKAMLETQYSTGLRNQGMLGYSLATEEGKKHKGLQVGAFLNLTEEELKIPALKAIHDYLPFREKMIKQLYAKGAGQPPYFMEAKVESGPLFINSTGNRYSGKSYTKTLHKVTGEERAWPKDIEHPIRHAWATHLIDQADDMAEIEKFLKAGDIEDLPATPADTSTGLQRAEPSTADPSGWGHLEDDDLVALHSHYVGEKKRIGFEGKGWKEASEFEKTLKHELDLRVEEVTKLSNFKKGDKVIREGTQYEIVKANKGVKWSLKNLDVPGGHKDEYTDWNPTSSTGFEKVSVRVDLFDENQKALRAHVLKTTGEDPGETVIVDNAIKVLKRYVEKGDLSDSYFTELKKDYLGTAQKKPRISTRVDNYTFRGETERVHYISEGQFKELGTLVMNHINANKASKEGGYGRLDISKAFDEETGIEVGEHFLLDSGVNPGDEIYVRVDTPGQDLKPTDINKGVDIIYRAYPDVNRGQYGNWGGYEDFKFDRATKRWISPEAPATQDAPGTVSFSKQHIITVGKGVSIQPGGRSSLGHPGTQVFFKVKSSFYRAFFVDPKKGPGVQAVRGYIEILMPTEKMGISKGIKEKYQRVGTILATGKELTDYSPGGARAGGPPDQLRLHPGEDAPPGVGPKLIPMVARKTVWRNEVLAPLESFTRGHYRGVRMKIAKAQGSREEMIGWAKELVEARQNVVGYLEAMQRGFKKEKPTGPGKTSGFSRAESDAAEAAGKPWNSPHAVAKKLGNHRFKLKEDLALVDELERSVKGLATISQAKKVLKKDLSRGAVIAVKNIKESITDLRVVNVGDKIRVAHVPGKPVRVREDHVLYRVGAGSWQVINRSDYETLSLRGMKPMGQLAWNDKKIDKEFVALLHFLGSATTPQMERVAIAKPYKGFIGFEKGAKVTEHGRKPVLGPFKLTRGASYDEPGGMRIAEQVGGQRRAQDPTAGYASGAREGAIVTDVVERKVGGGAIRREIEDIDLLEAVDDLYRQEGRVRILEEHEQSYSAGDEFVAVLRSQAPRKVKTGRGYASTGEPGTISHQVFEIIDDLAARYSNWDNFDSNTRTRLFNETYWGEYATGTDKTLDPDVMFQSRPAVEREYVRTGRQPDFQANYGQSDYVWYKYDRKRVNAEGEVEGGVVQAAIDKGELPPPVYRVGGSETHRRPPEPFVLDERARRGELIHSGRAQAPWEMSFQEFFAPAAMWKGDAPTSKFIYKGRVGGMIPEGAWKRGKVDVSIRSPGFRLDFELDISPIKKITGKGKLKRSRQDVSNEDLARLAWEKLQVKSYRDRVGGTEAAKPVEERLISSFTVEEYESLLIRKAVEIEERTGIMPYRPRVDMDASGKNVKILGHYKHKRTVNPEINPYLHYEAMLHLAGKGDYVGDGTLDAATRKALMAKGGKDWGLIGVSPRKGDTRSFLMLTLEERGFVDGKGKLKAKGQGTLDMWHAQQLAYDKRMAEIRATVKKGLPAEMADHINAELRLGKAKMTDLDANLIRELAVHHEHIVGAEHVKGLVPTAMIREVRSKPVKTARVKLKLGLAGKDKQAQTVFEYDKKLMTWVDENGKSVDELVRTQDALSKLAPNDRQRAVHYSKIDKLIELRDNLDITPSDQIAYRTARPIAKGGDPAAAGDLLKGADLDVSFGENKYAVMTRHEDGKISYAVFSSYGHAKSYQSALTPLEGDAIGSRRLFSDIIRGREGFKLGAALEAADYITAGTPLKKHQDYQGINAQIERLKFRAVQMGDAAEDLYKQIMKVKVSDEKITIKLPRWEANALGLKTAPGKPDELITSLRYKPGTYSEGVAKAVGEDYWDATATGYRTYTVTDLDDKEALIKRAIKRYNTLIEREMGDVTHDLHGLISERAGTKQPVGKSEYHVLGGGSEKVSTKARRTVEIDKAGNPVEGKLRPLGDQLDDLTDEATGGFANVSTLLGVSLVGAVAATVGDVGGEVFQGMADSVATFLKSAFLQVTGDGVVTFKQSLAGLATGGFVLAEGLGKSLKDIASRSTKKAKDLLIGLRDKAGNIIKKLTPEERARGMKTELQTETPGQRERRVKKHTGRLVGDEATVALKSVDNDIFEFPRSNEGMVSRWTKAEGKHFDLSKHSANPIKVPIIPKYGVKLNARNQPPYDTNSTDLRRIIIDATNALVKDGWTVTEATWAATFKNKTGVKMRGLIISKPGVVTPAKIQQHIDRAWDAAAHRVWDVEGIKLHQEAEEILDDLPQEYREAFITWWQHERGAQDEGISGRYTGRKHEYKFWKAVSDYSTGRKTLKLARRDLPGGKHERFAMSSEYGPHTVPKEETLLYRSYDEVMRRDAPDIEYRSGTVEEAAELRSREEIAAAQERGDYVNPFVEEWVDQMMRSIDGLDTEKGRALARAMRYAEKPELHSLIPGLDAEAKYINFKMLSGGEQQKIRQAFIKEMEAALKEFLDSPEGEGWQIWLHGLSEKLAGFSDASKGLIGKGAWRNIMGVLRFARNFWRGSRLSGLARFMWKVDTVKQASRSLARIFKELATEPNRAKARALFMESGDLLGRIPDKIKRGLGLPPFEEEYARNMTKNVPLNWIRWAAKRVGIDMPTGMQRKGLEGVIGRGAGPGVTEARATVSKVTGAKPSGMVGSARQRIGATRYRDRPLIKEAMQRREHIISEKRKKKKKRDLRLPLKLQRSS